MRLVASCVEAAGGRQPSKQPRQAPVCKGALLPTAKIMGILNPPDGVHGEDSNGKRQAHCQCGQEHSKQHAALRGWGEGAEGRRVVRVGGTRVWLGCKQARVAQPQPRSCTSASGWAAPGHLLATQTDAFWLLTFHCTTWEL